MRRQRVTGRGIEAQRALDRADKVAARFRIATGEQRDLMTPPYKLVGQTPHDSLGATVHQRRDSLVEWRHLRNP
jgi:hypothetical protein